MFGYFWRGAVLVLSAWLACQTPAQAQYSTNFDTLANGVSVLTNSTGSGQWMGLPGATATVSNNTYSYSGITYSNFVIFQGEISNIFARVSPDGNNEASAQLLLQAVWSDVLPDNSVCPDRQGGICISNGDVYAWATNGWLKLINTNGPAVTVPSNTWTKVSFVANYTGASFGSPANVVFYKVYINGTNLVPTSTSDRYSHGSPFYQSDTGNYLQSAALYDVSTPGIQGFYLAGSGAMDSLSSNAGNPLPLSSSIEIRSYQGADGVYVEFVTSGEASDGGSIVLYLFRDGAWAEVGRTNSVGPGSNRYLFKVPGLTVGTSYAFRIRDEVGNYFSAPSVPVTAFATAMLSMSPEGINMLFNTIPGRQYSVQWASRLGDSWLPVTNVTANTEQTSLFVFFPDPKAPSGFFRIVLAP